MLNDIREGFLIITEFFSLLQLIVASVCTVIILIPANDKTKPLWKRISRSVVLIIILLAMMIILDTTLLVVSKNWLLFLRGSNFPLSVFICVMIFSFAFCRYDWKHKLLFTMLAISTIVTVMEIGGPVNYIKSTDEEDALLIVNVIEAVCNVLSLASAILIRRLSVLKYRISMKASIIIIASSTLMLIMALVHAHLVTVWDIFNLEYGVKIFIVVLFVIIFLINLGVYILTYFLCKEQYNLLELQLLNKKKEADAEMLRLSELNLQELREIRHDISNQYGYIKSLIELEDYASLKTYAESFLGSFAKKIGNQIDCGNADVNSIINLEITKAYGYGIKLNTDIFVPNKLDIHAMDLYGLIGNLVDNALENCSVKEGAEVNVIMRFINKQFYIKVENPTDKEHGELKDTLETSKKDKVNHGYGTKIVKRIAVKYNGYVRYKVADGKFIAEVLLNT